MWETELCWHFMDVAYSCTDGKKAIEPTGEQMLREAACVHSGDQDHVISGGIHTLTLSDLVSPQELTQSGRLQWAKGADRGEWVNSAHYPITPFTSCNR